MRTIEFARLHYVWESNFSLRFVRPSRNRQLQLAARAAWQAAFAAHPHSEKTGVRQESSANREMLWNKSEDDDDVSSHGWYVYATRLVRRPCHNE